MKSAIGLLFATAFALASACSSSDGKFAAGTGGTTATGGSGGSGGATTAPITTPTELRDSGLSYDAGETKVGEDSPLFGTLEPIVCGQDDPCCLAIIWQTAEPLQNIEPPMNAGAYVVQDNDKHLYKYVGKEEVNWPLPGCSPSNPTLGHCNGTQWWEDMGIECP
jgi:hypothetical protein